MGFCQIFVEIHDARENNVNGYRPFRRQISYHLEHTYCKHYRTLPVVRPFEIEWIGGETFSRRLLQMLDGAVEDSNQLRNFASVK